MARFDEVKATFWSGDAYGVLPPLSEEMVKDAERLLDVSLPSSLVELLQTQNGGGVAAAWDAFPTFDAPSWSEDHVPFDVLMGIGGHMSLLDTPYLVQEWGLPSPVVLLSGDGHCWIALDYRQCGRQGDPSATWFDTELETEAALAPDFRSFVEGLTAGSDFVHEELDSAL